MLTGAKARSFTTSGFGLAVVAAAAIWLPTADLAGSPKSNQSGLDIDSPWLNDVNCVETTSDSSKEIQVERTSVHIKQLQTISGLTNKELGHVFQVSRRSIHNWANGSPVSSLNARRVRDFYYLVGALGGNTPEQRRSLLLSGAHGESLIEKFMSDGESPQQLQYTLPVMDRLG